MKIRIAFFSIAVFCLVAVTFFVGLWAGWPTLRSYAQDSTKQGQTVMGSLLTIAAQAVETIDSRARTPTLVPTDALTATPTVNASAFDMTTAKPYQSDDDVLEMQIPAGWTTPPSNRLGVYDIAYGDIQNPLVFIEVRLSKAEDFYKAIDLTGKANSPASALQALITENSGSALNFSAVQAASIGKLKGFMITASQPAGTTTNGSVPASEYDIRAALIPNSDQLVYVQIFSVQEMWQTAQPIVLKMLDSLVLKPQNLSTVTPTVALTNTAIPVRVTLAGNSITLPDGLQYIDTVVGIGDTAVAGKILTVNYTGMLTDGTIFDGSDKFSVQIGVGQVIKGWDEGLIGMKVGGKRTLIIPPALGYGALAEGKIPADSTLIFDVELISVK